MKILFITTRSPLSVSEHDGGTIFASQVIRHIAPRSTFDILSLRPPDVSLGRLPGVNAVHFITPDAGVVNRFERRLETALLVREWLRKRHHEYDALVAQHVSSGFGIVGLSEEAADKMIVFPMFTGVAYARSGEPVPPAYVEAERHVLSSAKKIFCPSRAEAQDIIEGYGVSAGCFDFVPFGVDLSTFAFQQRTLRASEPELLYVATVKRQKNQIAVLALLERLRLHGIRARINLVGGVGDPAYYAELRKQISLRGLEEQVEFHGVLAPARIALIARRCSLSISVSRWETYGIAIFESLAMGMPVVAFDDIPCFWEYIPKDGACVGVHRSATAMADRIAAFHEWPADYERRSSSARAEVAHLDERTVLPDVLAKVEAALR